MTYLCGRADDERISCLYPLLGLIRSDIVWRSPHPPSAAEAQYLAQHPSQLKTRQHRPELLLPAHQERRCHGQQLQRVLCPPEGCGIQKRSGKTR